MNNRDRVHRNHVRRLNVDIDFKKLQKLLVNLKYEDDDDDGYNVVGIPRSYRERISNLLNLDDVHQIDMAASSFVYATEYLSSDVTLDVSTYLGKTMVIILKGVAEVSIYNAHHDEDLISSDRLREGSVLGFEEDGNDTARLQFRLYARKEFQALVASVETFNEILNAIEGSGEYLF